MISDKYKCIHIHIPKCAGSSIDCALNNKDGNGFVKRKKMWRQHVTANETKKHYASEKQWNEYFKFTIVRNPFERLVSSYNFVCSKAQPSDSRDLLLFKHFVFRTGPFKKKLNPNLTHYRGNRYHQIKPSVEYIYENNNLLVDYVGRFENLENEWDFICEKLGTNIKLPHRNKNNRKDKHYRDYYNDETKDFVSQTYKKDLEIFGYEF